eukprot:PLAT6441.1.p1 GENE.PLAT6441.1~~PLAT6441.1.p1  ORF type:complete len:437 (-),score=110.96 PLAT6441.1:110-1420(-)
MDSATAAARAAAREEAKQALLARIEAVKADATAHRRGMRRPHGAVGRRLASDKAATQRLRAKQTFCWRPYELQPRSTAGAELCGWTEEPLMQRVYAPPSDAAGSSSSSEKKRPVWGQHVVQPKSTPSSPRDSAVVAPAPVKRKMAPAASAASSTRRRTRRHAPSKSSSPADSSLPAAHGPQQRKRLRKWVSGAEKSSRHALHAPRSAARSASLVPPASSGASAAMPHSAGRAAGRGTAHASAPSKSRLEHWVSDIHRKRAAAALARRLALARASEERRRAAGSGTAPFRLDLFQQAASDIPAATPRKAVKDDGVAAASIPALVPTLPSLHSTILPEGVVSVPPPPSVPAVRRGSFPSLRPPGRGGMGVVDMDSAGEGRPLGRRAREDSRARRQPAPPRPPAGGRLKRLYGVDLAALRAMARSEYSAVTGGSSRVKM